jgi:hypothetical protein
MQTITTIDLDSAKSVFQVQGVGSRLRCTITSQLSSVAPVIEQPEVFDVLIARWQEGWCIFR